MKHSVELREFKYNLSSYKGKYSTLINGNNIMIHNNIYESILRIYKPKSILDYDNIYSDDVEYECLSVDNEKESVDMVIYSGTLKHKLQAFNNLNNGGYFVSTIYNWNTDTVLDTLSKMRNSYFRGCIKYIYSDKKVYPIWIFQKVISIDKALFDPPCVITPASYEDKVFNVVREDMLIGGAKQRVTYSYINNISSDIIFYHGAHNGYAQVAIANTCLLLGKKFHIIVKRKKFKHNIICLAMLFGAIVHEIDDNDDPLSVVEKYNGYLIPLGIKGISYEDTQLTILNKYNPKDIWLIASTGATLAALHNILPECRFHVVFVAGFKADIASLEYVVSTNTSTEFFKENTKIPPLYPSELSYDAKIWQFVITNGKSGDYIFNVAGL